MIKPNFSLLLKLLYPYLLILAFPSLALYSIYHTAVNQAFDAEKEKNLFTLQQSSNKVDNQLQSFSEISKSLAYNPEIISLLNLNQTVIKDEEFFRIYQLCSRLPNYKLINPVIEDVFIIFGDLEYVIQIPTAYRLSDSSLPLEVFNLPKNFLSTEHQNTIFSSSNHSGILLFSNSLPYSGSNNINNQLMISLNANQLFADLKNIEVDTTGGVFVMDASGNLIASYFGPHSSFTPDDFILEDTLSFNPHSKLKKDYILTSITSDYNMWTYVSIVPNHLITAQVNYIKSNILILIVATLITTIILCCFLAFRSSLSLTEILNYFNQTSPSKSLRESPYKQIQKSVGSLISQNQQLSGIINEQSTLLSHNIIKDIMTGAYESPYSLAKTLHTLSLNLRSSAYVVVIFKLVDSRHTCVTDTSNQLLDTLFKEAIDKCCTSKHHYFDIDSDSFGMLCLLDDHPQSYNLLSEELTEIHELVLTTDHIDTLVIQSTYCTHLLDVKNLYLETISLYKYATLVAHLGLLRSKDVTIEPTDTFEYSLSTEINLIHTLQQQPQSEFEAILKEIFDTNLIQRHLNIDMLEQLIFSIRRTLIQALSGLEDSSLLISKLSVVQSFPRLYDYALETYEFISNKQHAKQNSEDQQLIQEIKKFIEANYQNSSFNLCTLSELCNMNEHTLYKEFKEWFGITFSDYLENYRIQIACNLLSEKSIPIKDIANLVGYNSDYSFRRAFKRILGVPPSKYTSAI